MEQPSQAPSPTPAKPQRHRPTAQEVRKNHGIYAAITLALMMWFVRDGWFNPDPKMLEHLLFNRSGSVICGVLFAFFATMVVSAHFAIQRQQKPQPATPPQSENPPPPTA